jgi:hypothetical protein
MPRRTYIRVENGVPVFPVGNRNGDVLPTRNIVRGPNGELLGLVSSIQPVHLNRPSFNDFGNVRIGTIGTVAMEAMSYTMGVGRTGVIQAPIGRFVEDAGSDDPHGIRVDFQVMHGLVLPEVLEVSPLPETSALDMLLEKDDDDPIS